MKAVNSTIICLFFFVQLLPAFSQKLIDSKDFVIGTSFLEPDEKNGAILISGSEFVTLAKTKGNLYGQYLLSKYDTSLNVKWETRIEESEVEDILNFYYLNQKLVVLSNMHDTKNKYASLHVSFYDPLTGSKLESRTLDSVSVNPYADNAHKAQVKETFNECVAASLKKNYVVPFEYKYTIQFSPDSSHIIAYIFDFSREELAFTGVLLDKNMQRIAPVEKALGDNLINHGVFVNNKGELFILNTESSGKIGLTRFVKGDRKSSSYLDAMATNLARYSFKLKFISDEIIYVVNLNEQNGACTGLTFYRFNFLTNTIENWVDHDFTENLKNKVHNDRLMKKAGDENYLNFMIDNFYVDQKEDLFITIEKREIRGTGYRYDKFRGVHPDNYVESSLNVLTEGIFILHIDKEGNRNSEEYFFKSQKDLINGGLNTISFVEDYQKTEIRLFYAGSEGFAEVMNKMFVAEFDITNGELIKNFAIENPEGLTLLRKYTLITPTNKLISVGKKGFLGKSSRIFKAQLN